MTAPADQYAAAMAQLIEARTGQMLDACFVARDPDPGQTPELDADGNVVTPPPATIYDGSCVIADPTVAQRSQRTTNDQAGVPHERVLRLPVGSPELLTGDLVTITSAAFSPGLIGEEFLVVADEEHRTYSTHDRYRIRGSSWTAS